MPLDEKQVARLLREIPIFGALPRMELAKLQPDMAWVEAPAGTVLTMDSVMEERVYFVCAGRVNLHASVDGDTVRVLTLGPSSAFGALGFVTNQTDGQRAVAESHVTLLQLSAQRLQEVFQRNPRFAGLFLQLVTSRLALVQTELVRARRLLASYQQELWEEDVTVTQAEACVGMQEQAAVQAPASQGLWVLKVVGIVSAQAPVLLGVLAAVCLWFGLRTWTTITIPTQVSIVVLGWAAWMWGFTKLPDYAIAMAACLAFVLLGAAAPNVAFSGFADPTWFMILGVFGMGAAITRTGLLYRMALHMLNKLPLTYRGQTLAMSLTGLLLTPCLPSANARIALAAPLARELGEGMGFAWRSNGIAGMGLSSLLGFGNMFFPFLNGTSTCLLVWGLLPPDVRAHVTWGYWAIVALPLALFAFVLSYLAIIWLLPVAERQVLLPRGTIRAQLETLGPMSWEERLTLGLLVGVLLALVTEPYHHVSPAWSAMAGFLVLLVTGLVDKEAVKRYIDWPFLLLFGALVSVATVTRQTDLQGMLAAVLRPVMTPFVAYPVLFLLVVALLTVILRFLVPWQPAVLILLVALTPVAQSAGYSPFLVGLVILALSSPYLLAQQNTLYTTVEAAMEERFTHRQVLRVALAHTAILLVGVVLTVPYWHLLRLLP